MWLIRYLAKKFLKIKLCKKCKNRVIMTGTMCKFCKYKML